MSDMTVGVLISSALVMAFMTYAFVNDAGRRRLTKRTRKLALAQAGASRGEQALILRLNGPRAIDQLFGRFLPRPTVLNARLAAAGVGFGLAGYAIITLIVGVVSAGVIFSFKEPLILVVGGGIAGAVMLPYLAIESLIKRRRLQFEGLFPEAIGLMVRGIRAGLPITETFSVVGREVKDPVGVEFRRVADQLRLNQALEEALASTAKRLEMIEFNFLVITLSIQRETGGNLAETLENLEDILRKRSQMRLKIKAMSSEAVASASILGALPFVVAIMLYMIKPTYLMALFTTSTGMSMLGAGGASLAIGIFIMARMVDFEI